MKKLKLAAGLLVLAGIVLLLVVLLPAKAKKEAPAAAIRQQTFFAGTRQEVTAYFITGQEKGPTMLIFGGVHGDEKAGYLTAERYCQTRLRKGNLIIVPRLNAIAIAAGKRQGLGGDLNRLFNLPEKGCRNPDRRVVDLAKTLMQRADYVLNLHQAYDFYSPRWISRKRNPTRWGQSNVIDTPVYQLHNGVRLEPGQFAQKICNRSNVRIKDRNFNFLVNNTDTSDRKSRHREQQGSLTYYALTKQHKIALGMEATKNCSLPEAIGFLTIAINAAIAEAGIQADTLPAEESTIIAEELGSGKKPAKTEDTSLL